MKFSDYLESITGLSPAFEKEFESLFEKREIRKGTILFEQDKICRHLFFIEKGMARTYYYSNTGKEITAWFSAENSFITAIDSFFYNKTTRDNCEVIEDSTVYAIMLSDFEQLLNKDQGARLAFKVLYDITGKMSDYIASIKFQTAEERYNTLMKNSPLIFQRATLGHIASYLGITQETLSRIRAAK